MTDPSTLPDQVRMRAMAAALNALVDPILLTCQAVKSHDQVEAYKHLHACLKILDPELAKRAFPYGPPNQPTMPSPDPAVQRVIDAATDVAFDHSIEDPKIAELVAALELLNPSPAPSEAGDVHEGAPNRVDGLVSALLGERVGMPPGFVCRWGHGWTPRDGRPGATVQISVYEGERSNEVVLFLQTAKGVFMDSLDLASLNGLVHVAGQGVRVLMALEEGGKAGEAPKPTPRLPSEFGGSDVD